MENLSCTLRSQNSSEFLESLYPKLIDTLTIVNLIVLAFSLLPRLLLAQGPDLQDEVWQKTVSEDGIIVYAGKKHNGLIPFKAEGLIDSPPDLVLAIILDYSNKPKWAPKLKSVKLHQSLGQNTFVFSEYYSTPWPATDREFLLKGNFIKTTDGGYRLKASSLKNDRLSDSAHIQAQVHKLITRITPTKAGQTMLSFEFLGDMQGWIPLWVMNIIQKKWPLRVIQNLRKRAQYLKENNLRPESVVKIQTID